MNDLKYERVSHQELKAEIEEAKLKLEQEKKMNNDLQTEKSRIAKQF